jgi:hypothetical protein
MCDMVMIAYATAKKNWKLNEKNLEEGYEAFGEENKLLNELVEALNREFENPDSPLSPKKQVEQFKKIAKPLNPDEIE